MKNSISISNTILLEEINSRHSREFFLLTNKNRTYLKQWLPWLDYVQSEKDTLDFIQKVKLNRTQGFGPTYIIKDNSIIVGIIGFHPIDKSNKIGEIGYWLSEDAQGSGTITLSCKELIKIGFEELELNRIQIPAAEKNIKSRSIPERLNFTFEGIIRDRENLYGNFVNHAMYSILKAEYEQNNT